MVRLFTFTLMLVLFAGLRPAMAEGYQMHGTEMHTLSSDVLGEDLQIAVALPFGYSASEAAFPLMVGLDGDVMFGMEAEVARLLSFEGQVPPMLVASVIYGDFQSWIAKRQRDYHPGGGGADKFLAALKAEIMPFLAKTYRVDAGRTVLYGHSSAGLFAYYAGIKEPGLFSRILATSPSLEEEPEWAATFPRLIEEATALPAFYVAADASEDKIVTAVTPSFTSLQAKAGEARATFDVLAEGSHMSVIPKSFKAGLYYLFSR